MSHDRSEQKKGQEGFDEGNIGTVADWVKKAIGSGLGGVFSPEDGSLKGVMPEFKLPKEVLALLMTQMERAKKEAINVVAREVAHFLENLEIQEIIKKVLAGSTIEINATIKVDNDAKGTFEAKKVSVEKKKTQAKATKKNTASRKINKK